MTARMLLLAVTLANTYWKGSFYISKGIKIFLCGAVAVLTFTPLAFGQALGLPSDQVLAERRRPSVPEGDCMGISKPDPKFSKLPACERNKDAVKRPDTNTGAVWSLVAQRTVNGQKYQVWYDSNTGLIWGDRLDSYYTHFKAVELDSSENVTKETACASAEGLRANAGIGSRKFRLPTSEEYQQAEKDGIRKVLPNIRDWFWSAEVNNLGNTGMAFGFNGVNGAHTLFWRHADYSVRCVSR